MKLNNFAILFLAEKADPKIHRATIKIENVTYTTVGIDFQHKEQVIEIAKELIANGAQIIELCGGFGPIWIAKVIEATKNQVPIGGVFYGPESRKPLIDLGLIHTLKF